VNTYYYKLTSADPVNSEDLTSATEIGLLAQELEGSFPGVVVQGRNGTKYVNYNAVVALLLGAVRKLNERVGELERKLN
jgi:hypothetical protein